MSSPGTEKVVPSEDEVYAAVLEHEGDLRVITAMWPAFVWWLAIGPLLDRGKLRWRGGRLEIA